MDIKDSKFFVAADLKILRALGFRDLEVNVDTEGESEEIALGDNQYLVGERGDLGTSYYVIDRDCHEAFTHGETSIMALAHYQSSSLTNYNYDEIPDYFWMWELREIFYRKNNKKGVSAKRFQRYRDEPGMAVVFSADCKKVKIAKNKFSKYDKDWRYSPLPDELPAFDEWEAIKDKDGKPLVANCSKVFSSRSFAEETRALNILLKKFYKRINGK
jgi:anaerobic selenocysteine-containing dehydrogenase